MLRPGRRTRSLGHAGRCCRARSGRIYIATRDNRLDEQVKRFADKAEKVDDAFGVLSESTEALAKYVEMTKATVTSLQQLRQQLAGYARGLDHSAASYEHTDAQHAAAFKGA